MYKDSDNMDVESICFEQRHIDTVITVIKKNFDHYFNSVKDA